MAWSPQARKAAALARKRKSKGRKYGIGRDGKTRLTKAQLKKKKLVSKNQKKVNSKRTAKKGLVQYKKTGLVTPTSSKSWRQTTRKMRKGSKMNKKYGKKLARADRRIAKAKKKRR